MTAPPPAPAAPTGERRGLMVAGLCFFGALVVLIGLVTVLAGGEGDERTTSITTPCPPDDRACTSSQRGGERPGIIPQPGAGQRATDPGEPGGWEQIALFFAIVIALGVIAVLIVRSVRRNAHRRTPDPDPPTVSP